MNDTDLRDHLTDLLEWESAHVGYDTAVADLPESAFNLVPDGAEHSPWQLIEHIRIAQRDILDFCIEPDYRELRWPIDYWPSNGPVTRTQWRESVESFRTDRQRLIDFVRNGSVDLFARVPNGTGQTYLREVLLVADHSSYHIGQLVLTRRMLGVWPHE